MGKERMQHAMTYAVLLGVYLAISFFVLSAGVGSVLMQVLWLVMALSVPFIVYYFQKKYRDDLLEGNVSYFGAFSYGISLFFYSSLIIGAILFIYLQFINPDFILNTFNNAIVTLQQLPNVQHEMIDELLKMPLPGTGDFVFNMIMMNIFTGFFISLITSIFVKKDNVFN